jgi:hypothetical protein
MLVFSLTQLYPLSYFPQGKRWSPSPLGEGREGGLKDIKFSFPLFIFAMPALSLMEVKNEFPSESVC